MAMARQREQEATDDDGDHDRSMLRSFVSLLSALVWFWVWYDLSVGIAYILHKVEGRRRVNTWGWCRHSSERMVVSGQMRTTAPRCGIVAIAQQRARG